MKILKEELDHHQQKVDQYYAFVDNIHETREKTPEMENHIGHFLEDEEVVRAEKKGKSKDRTPPPKIKLEKAETVSIRTLRGRFLVDYEYRSTKRLHVLHLWMKLGIDPERGENSSSEKLKNVSSSRSSYG